MVIEMGSENKGNLSPIGRKEGCHFFSLFLENPGRAKGD